LGVRIIISLFGKNPILFPFLVMRRREEKGKRKKKKEKRKKRKGKKIN